MKNCKRICMMAVIASGIFGVQAFAAEKTAVPTEMKFQVKVNEALRNHEKSAYNIDGNNYFMLRDIGSVLGYGVEWDSESKMTSVILNQEAKDMSGKIGDANATATAIRGTIKVSNGRMASMQGYNIDGYTYYAIRDIAKLLDYSCGWEAECILLAEGKAMEQRAKEITVPSNMEARVNEIVKENEEWKSKRNDKEGDKEETKFGPKELHAIKQKDVIYFGNSGAYGDIEKYIQENLNEDFDSSDYIVYENNPATGVPLAKGKEYVDNALPEKGQLRFYYEVGGARSNFGYTVRVFDGIVKIIQPFGEWNPNVEGKEFTPKYTAEEVVQMAIDDVGMGKGYALNETDVETYFDMKTEKFKYDAILYFTEGDMHLRGISRSFED